MTRRLSRAGLWWAAAALALLAADVRAAAVAERPAPGTEFRLWPGRAPGTENWRRPESVTRSPSGDRIIRNVSEPTLTAWLPDAAKANGAAVIIAPGGALRLLSYDEEGVKLAQWFAGRGIAAFVLKYRTLQVDPQAPLAPPPPPGGASAPRQEIVIRKANANPDPDNAALAEVLRFAIEDARMSMRLVRRNAEAWTIDPGRVGLLGFSAGGGVAVGTLLAGDAATSPDFLVSLYGPSLMDVQLQPDAPPLFIAVGSGHFNVTSGCVALFDAWRTAHRPVELHVYDGVTAGFGSTSRGRPVDGWKDRLHEWLAARGLLRRNE